MYQAYKIIRSKCMYSIVRTIEGQVLTVKVAMCSYNVLFRQASLVLQGVNVLGEAPQKQALVMQQLHEEVCWCGLKGAREQLLHACRHCYLRDTYPKCCRALLSRYSMRETHKYVNCFLSRQSTS